MTHNYLTLLALSAPLLFTAGEAAAAKKTAAAPKKAMQVKPKTPAKNNPPRPAEVTLERMSGGEAPAAGPSTSAGGPRYTAQKEEAPTREPKYNNLNCDFHYQTCMNNICTDRAIGKCVCYEDNFATNFSGGLEHATIDGQKVKKGMDLFGFARGRCAKIADACPEMKRGITTKYESGVQRDCLRLAEAEAVKDKSIAGEIKELKDCMRDWCTMATGGRQNFNVPEFGLCFDEAYANFTLDTKCVDRLAESKTPLAVREMLMNQLAALRDISCQFMHGEMTSDRKDCQISVSYGPNKEKIKYTKRFNVGDIVSCNDAAFSVRNQTTQDYRDEQARAKKMVAVSSIRAASGIVGTVGGMVGKGGIVSKIGSADMALTNMVQKGVETKEMWDLVKAGDSNMTEAEATMQTGINIGMMATQALSVAMSFKGGGGGGGGMGTAIGVLNAAASATDLASGIVDYKMQEDINAAKVDMEREGLISSRVDRAAGTGQVNQNAALERGNCFVNGDFFATDNEVVQIHWTM